MQSNKSLAAAPFGNSEGNCATPNKLYDSAIAFMRAESADTPFVFYTGDFSEAGASYPCSPESSAQEQVTTLIETGTAQVKMAFPKAKVFGCLGNHDTAPGDVFGSTEEMAWLYESLAITWAADLNHDETALRDLAKGGFYAVNASSPSLNITVVALNTNYWATMNSKLKDLTGGAYALGQEQFVWLEGKLKEAQSAGEWAPVQ
jgi:hypothetical protein